jgi:hypothetical protein
MSYILLSPDKSDWELSSDFESILAPRRGRLILMMYRKSEIVRPNQIKSNKVLQTDYSTLHFPMHF